MYDGRLSLKINAGAVHRKHARWAVKIPKQELYKIV
jgi:hypothetical protein